MATFTSSTNNNSKQQRTFGYGKLTTRRTRFGLRRFVRRPVVQARRFDFPSMESHMNFSLVLNELKEKFRWQEEKRRIHLRAQQLVGNKTFTEVLKQGLKPLVQFSVVPETEKVNYNLLSRRDARLDYKESLLTLKQQRKAAKELILAIAQRYPKVIPVKETPAEYQARRLVADKKRRLLLQQLRLKRRAQEVEQFEEGCYWDVPIPDSYPNPFLVIEDRKIARACSPRFIKKRPKRPFPQTEKEIENMRPRIPLIPMDPMKVAFLLFRMKTYWDIKRRGMPLVMFDYLSKIDKETNEEVVSPQMDTEGVVEDAPVVTEQRSNIAIVEASKWDGVSNIVSRAGLSAESVSIERKHIDTYTHRWLKIYSGDWTTTQMFNTTLVSLSLPGYVLRNFPNSTLSQILYMNRFFRMTLEVKVVLNSSMWQIGSIIVDWLYGPSEANAIHGNVISAMQRTHGQMNAGSANNVQLEIPYHNVDSFMSYYNDSRRISFGTLSVRVLNPLTANAKVSNKASYSIYIAFKDVEAHGLVARNQGLIPLKEIPHVIPQMEDIGRLCNLGSNVLRTAGNLMNRDNPPLPLQPISFVPQTMSSLCHTDGIVEPVNVLRSDSRGQRINPVVTDEVSFEKFLKTWGYVSQFSWAMQDYSGLELYKLDVAPLLEQDAYTVLGTIPGSPEINKIVYPPISFLASFMSKFRGSIEILLEVICNSTYTGTLQLSAIPHPHTIITQEDAAMSASMIFDIKKTTKIVFTVPWNWYNSWQLTRKGNRSSRLTDSIAVFHVSVINPLIAIDGVPNRVFVNVFMRAGPSFEFCQLRTPILALANSVIKPPSSEYLQPYNFETAWYVTSDKSLHDDDGRKYPTIFIQDITNGWVGYVGVLPFVVYKLATLTNLEREFRCQYGIIKTNDKGKDVAYTAKVQYGVYHEALSTDKAHGLVVFYDKVMAGDFALYMKRHGYKIGLNEYSKKYKANLVWDGKDGAWSQIKMSDTWKQADNQTGEHPLWTRSTSLRSDEVVPQMDRDTVTISLEKETPSTNYGELVFGERLKDLLSVGKRWQLFGSIQVKACVSALIQDCQYSFIIPLKPWRKLDPKSSASYDNRVRDGPISLISGCFALYDGGQRFRLVATHTVPENTKVTVVHDFDNVDYLEKMVVGPIKVRTYEDLLDTSYPAYCQDLSINPVITVEVPYMSDRERLSCYDTSSIDCMNGVLKVWVHSPKPVDVDFQIFYKVADDFQWSVFQGIPPLLDITDIQPEPLKTEEVEIINIEPQMGNPFESDDEEIEQGVEVDEEFKEYLEREDLVEPTAQGFDFFGIRKAISNINKTTDKLSAPAEEALTNFSSLTKRLERFLEGAKAVPGKLSKKHEERLEAGDMSFLRSWGEIAFDYLTHFVYLLLNPTIKTGIWTLINLYRTIWGLTLEGFTSLHKAFTDFWAYLSRSKEQKQIAGQMEGEEVGSICSIIYASFATMTKMTSKPPLSWTNITKGLFDFSSTCRESGYISRFFKDNVELLKRIWRSFVGSFSKRDKNLELISNFGDERAKKWMLDCYGITSPTIRKDVLTKPHWAEKVFELAIVGRYIVNAICSSRIAPMAYVHIARDLLAKITTLEDELVARNVFCGERYEPFCLWAGGPAGTGKTTFLHRIAEDLAVVHNSKSVNTYHTITVQQRYFDGYSGQPSILIDDMFTESSAQDTVGPMFIQMKSAALFNPAFSAVKDKCTLVNFYNLLVSSNYLSSHGRLVHDESAYDRRRDCLLEFVFRAKTPAEGTGMWNKIEASKEVDYIEKFKNLYYLDVYRIPDPLKVEVKILIPRKPNETYLKTVSDFVLSEAARYHEMAAQLFKERMDRKMARINKLCSEEDNVNTYLNKIHEMYQVDAKQASGFSLKKFMEAWKVPKCGESEFSSKVLHDNFKEPVAGPSQLPGKVKPKKDDTDASEPLKDDSDVSTDEHEVPIKGDGVLNLSTWEFNNNLEGLQKRNKETSCSVANCQGKYEPDGQIFEPICRYHSEWDPMVIHPGDLGSCPHMRLEKEISLYFYDETTNCFKRQPFFVNSYSYASISTQQCTVISDKGTKLKPCGSCPLGDRDTKLKLIYDIVESYFRSNPDLKKNMTNLLKFFPKDWWFAYRAYYMLLNKRESPPKWFKEISDEIEKSQLKVRTQIVWVDGIPLLRHPPRTVCQRVWDAFIKLCDIMVNVFMAIFLFLSFILFLLYIVMAVEAIKTPIQSQIHPSGDFKVIKNTKSMRQQALSLIKNEGAKIMDKDIYQSTLSNNFSNDSNGRLRKIESNIFTLSGIKMVGDRRQTINARCIGLRNYEFLVLKHYIEQFESMGITDIGVVFRHGLGLQHYKLSDLKFTWTEQGYGIGKFPTLARPFKTITQFLPSENFDGSYPSKMIMVEVFTESTHVYELDVTLIRHPVVVPPSGSQSSWTIRQGFEYSWGGSGRCGSFLFCPELASPLVAVHTAGAGSKRGFAELLLRETFVDPNVVEVDMVSPQMPVFEDGYMLEGEGLVVGHLEPEKAAHIPTKTKIVPSIIAGVFPVLTEPAPMSKFDERLSEPCDPLHEGIKKRCDKPLEFDSGTLHEAFLDLREKFKFLKPLRTPETLSISQAIEGFEIEGYEAIETSTSEGYPWVLDRPKGATSKAWMFDFEEDPKTHRKKLMKIYTPLYTSLKEKDEMRKNLQAPVTYFTACLKDARISKEKVGIPGKTRVFEMSPVDLTIAQRQYFLDFIAAYQKGRLDMENTIGINPDGPEWTQLANNLNNFSPYILTADYSAYGPRLLHSVQFYTYLLEIDWYMRQYERLGYSEEELEIEFNRRYSMLYEVLNNHTVVKNAVVCFATGMPSGNVATVIKNSEGNSLHIRVAYKELAKRYAPEYADMYWFNKMVLCYFNGDDLIMAVKAEIIKWFNNRTLIEFFAEHNIKMTDAQKSGSVREYCTLEEATYLKRGFQKHPFRKGEWMAPLEESSITDTANWIWRCVDKKGASLINSEMCARLAYTRGPQYYDKIVSTLQDAWAAHGVRFQAPSWRSLDMHVWDGTEGPKFLF